MTGFIYKISIWKKMRKLFLSATFWIIFLLSFVIMKNKSFQAPLKKFSFWIESYFKSRERKVFFCFHKKGFGFWIKMDSRGTDGCVERNIRVVALWPYGLWSFCSYIISLLVWNIFQNRMNLTILSESALLSQ